MPLSYAVHIGRAWQVATEQTCYTSPCCHELCGLDFWLHKALEVYVRVRGPARRHFTAPQLREP